MAEVWNDNDAKYTDVKESEQELTMSKSHDLGMSKMVLRRSRCQHPLLLQACAAVPAGHSAASRLAVPDSASKTSISGQPQTISRQENAS